MFLGGILTGKMIEHIMMADIIIPLITIALAEWGDKTQIASALFATRYNALMVFIGTMVALTMLSIVAVYLGKVISNRIDKKLMTKIVGFGFIAMGISFFFF